MEKHGGKRENAGRKPKEMQLSLIEQLDAHIEPDSFSKELAEIIKNSTGKLKLDALKLYAEYRYGKPTQTVNQQMTFNESPAILFKKIDE